MNEGSKPRTMVADVCNNSLYIFTHSTKYQVISLSHESDSLTAQTPRVAVVVIA